MGLALAEEAARRGAEVTLVAANVRLPAPRRRAAGGRRDRRPSSPRALEHEFDAADVLLMAAAPADFRPAQPRGEKIHREGPAASSSTSSRPRTSWPRSRRRGARARRWSASPPRRRRGVERAREKLERKGARRDRLQRRLALRDRLRERRQRGHDRRARRRAPRAARLEGGGRRRDPRPGPGAPRRRAPRPSPATSDARRLRAAGAGPLHWVHDTTYPDESLYTLYRRGMELLEDGDFERGHRAARRGRPPGARRRARCARRSAAPTSATGRFAEAATEFEAVVETHPVNDYAHFCLGPRPQQDRRDAARTPPPGAGQEPAPRPPRLPRL